jgi:hypothetical protein
MESVKTTEKVIIDNTNIPKQNNIEKPKTTDIFAGYNKVMIDGEPSTVFVETNNRIYINGQILPPTIRDPYSIEGFNETNKLRNVRNLQPLKRETYIEHWKEINAYEIEGQQEFATVKETQLKTKEEQLKTRQRQSAFTSALLIRLIIP